jgi:quercetin dioxygenase-like cupin family protein
MKFFRSVASAVLVASSLVALHSAHAQQQPGFGRSDVLQHDLGNDGREVIQTRVEFAHGAVSPRHSHPGEEIAYVLEGTLEYHIECRSPITLKAGEALFIPAGAKHVAKNVGTGKASELATYLVSKGTPLLVIAK